MHWSGKCPNFVIDHLTTIKLNTMNTQTRKVEMRSDGSIVLLSWFIIVVAFIFLGMGRMMASEITTVATNHHRDHTTITNKRIPNIQKIVRTRNNASRIMKPVKLKMK